MLGSSALVPYLPLIGVALGLLFLAGAYRSAWKRRLLQDTPTSKTSGVFIGLVELKGSAGCKHPLTNHPAEIGWVPFP